MGQLVVNEKEGSLELEGFLLRPGDQLEIRFFSFWIPGTIAHNERGWYFLTTNQVGVRLRTGLAARSLLLPSDWTMSLA